MPRETRASRERRAQRIVRRLKKAYPEAKCALHHRNPFELLVATILSAQCTDKKVNEVTPRLFGRFPNAKTLAEANPDEVESLVRQTGFFRQKTKSLQAASRDIVERFGEKIPHTLEELTSLHGVARKTANVVLGNAFGMPALTVDTHMKRINRRLALSDEQDPDKIERDLMELIPTREWTDYSHRVIHHGRVCCDARRPQCEACPLGSECAWPDSRAGQALLRPRTGKARARPKPAGASMRGRGRP
jgi:endonuclease-3